MLIMDQRTMQIKYRIPAAEIFKLSLSPYHDDIAVFHVRAVSIQLWEAPAFPRYADRFRDLFTFQTFRKITVLATFVK